MKFHNNIYHIYNRTVDKNFTHFTISDKQHLLSVIKFYKFPQDYKFSRFNTLTNDLKTEYILNYIKKEPIVEIHAFCIMDNHFHLLVKETTKNSISFYLSIFQNSFAKYYNLKHERNGSLFQNRFKSRLIKDELDFIGVAKYIHLNPVEGNLIKINELPEYPWTSLKYLLNGSGSSFLTSYIYLNIFGSFEKYLDFLKINSTS